jgi:hypothetical protein
VISRAWKDKYTLDSYSFQLLYYKSKSKQFDNIQILELDFFLEIVELIKNIIVGGAGVALVREA